MAATARRESRHRGHDGGVLSDLTVWPSAAAARPVPQGGAPTDSAAFALPTAASRGEQFPHGPPPDPMSQATKARAPPQMARRPAHTRDRAGPKRRRLCRGTEEPDTSPARSPPAGHRQRQRRPSQPEKGICTAVATVHREKPASTAAIAARTRLKCRRWPPSRRFCQVQPTRPNMGGRGGRREWRFGTQHRRVLGPLGGGGARDRRLARVQVRKALEQPLSGHAERSVLGGRRGDRRRDRPQKDRVCRRASGCGTASRAAHRQMVL